MKINLNLSKKRERAYLEALRARYGKPTWDWSWLVARAIREVYALQMHQTPPTGDNDEK